MLVLVLVLGAAVLVTVRSSPMLRVRVRARARKPAVIALSVLAIACTTAQHQIAPDGSVWLSPRAGGPRLQLSLVGLRIVDVGREGSAASVSADDPRIGLFVTAGVHEAPVGVADCRAYYWGQVQRELGERTQQVTQREAGTWQVVEYFLPNAPLPPPDDVPINQQNVIACQARAGTFAYIHASKILYQPADDALFDALLSRATFTSR